MPVYDYRRADGTTFEAYREYGQHNDAVDNKGIKGVLVWLASPSVSIPVWHQSAPNEDAHTIRMMKRAADPKDSVRVAEAGTEADVKRRKKEKERRAQAAIDRNLTEAMREADLRVPE